MTIFKSSKDYSRLPNTHPAAFAIAVTPSDTLTLVDAHPSTPQQVISRWLMVTVAGTVTVRMGGVLSDNVTRQNVTFTALAGVMYPISVDMVMATGTAATGIVAFY